MRYLAGLVLIIALTSPARSQGNASTADAANSSLEKVKDKRALLLLVGRTRTVDTDNPESPIVIEAFRTAEEGRTRYASTFNAIARKLNKYLKKHRSISAATRVEDADFIVFFNLLGFRRSLYAYYPHGELFVILKDGAEGRPQVVWKSSKVMYADDAANELIKKLKMIRGEK